MDKKIEKKIRKLGPTPLVVLEHVLIKSNPTSAGTISDLDLGVKETGGGYSVLSRNNLVLPFGRDKTGSLRWEPSEEVKENKNEILDLIRKIR